MDPSPDPHEDSHRPSPADPHARVLLREATERDGAGIASVQVDGWRHAYGHLLSSRFYDDAELAERTRQWTRQLRDGIPPGQCLRVAEDAGLVVGFARSGPADPPVRPVQLFALYVRPEYHGAGVAARLLEAVCGVGPALLWVAEDNPRAHAFYRKHGFRPDGHEHAEPDLEGMLLVRLVR